MRVIMSGNLDAFSPDMLRFIGEYVRDRDVEATAARLGIEAGAARQLYSEPMVRAVIAGFWQAILDDVARYGRAIYDRRAQLN